MDRKTFRSQVEQALSDIRDVVALRTLPICGLLLPRTSAEERGWELSRVLLGAIDELRPTAMPEKSTPDGWVERRFRLLNLRFVNGLSPDAVADELCISRRHFYRQLQRAIDDLASYLETGLRSGESEGPGTLVGANLGLAASGLTLDGAASVASVVESVRALLDPLCARQGILWRGPGSSLTIHVAVHPEVLKQLLLSLLGPLLGAGALETIDVTASMAEREVTLALACSCRSESALASASTHERPSVQLAAMQGVVVSTRTEGAILTYEVHLPRARATSVLVVDDNDEVCLLFRRYLSNAGYTVLTATSGGEAVTLARAMQPSVVTLDLMMNREDGWDVLQTLAHDPATARVPIVVCSVLDQRDLALMLGAAAFLKKPVMADDLVQVIRGLLEQGEPGSAVD